MKVLLQVEELRGITRDRNRDKGLYWIERAGRLEAFSRMKAVISRDAGGMAQVAQGVRGDLFGSCCLLKGGRQPYTIIALTTTTVLLLNKWVHKATTGKTSSSFKLVLRTMLASNTPKTNTTFVDIF